MTAAHVGMDDPFYTSEAAQYIREMLLGPVGVKDLVVDPGLSAPAGLSRRLNTIFVRPYLNLRQFHSYVGMANLQRLGLIPSCDSLFTKPLSIKSDGVVIPFPRRDRPLSDFFMGS